MAALFVEQYSLGLFFVQLFCYDYAIKRKRRGVDEMTDEEKRFLEIVNDAELREYLLARLEQLGLLAAFLAAENETN